MGTFKKGLFLGGLLGVGLTLLNTTKKGKDTRDQILNHAAELYIELKKKISDSGVLEKMTAAEFQKMVSELVDVYADQKQIASNIAGGIKKILRAQWKTVQKEMKRKT